MRVPKDLVKTDLNVCFRENKNLIQFFITYLGTKAIVKGPVGHNALFVINALVIKQLRNVLCKLPGVIGNQAAIHRFVGHAIYTAGCTNNGQSMRQGFNYLYFYARTR